MSDLILWTANISSTWGCVTKIYGIKLQNDNISKSVQVYRCCDSPLCNRNLLNMPASHHLPVVLYSHGLVWTAFHPFHSSSATKLSPQHQEKLNSLQKSRSLPGAPFQKALKPSSLKIFRAASNTPLYVVWPARAATCKRVLMTSAGVVREAAGTPPVGKQHF